MGATAETVCVVGASGNVGKLVALRLSDFCTVHAVTRSPAKVKGFLDRDNIRLFESDVRSDEVAGLEDALRDATTVVACTGTTAFPTKAWSRSGKEEVSSAVLSALVEAGFDVRKAIASLDAQGLNTPTNVDERGVRAVLAAWARAAGKKRKRFVLMSSIGVTKRDGFPFKVLNACGVLDAKAAGEAALRDAAKADGFAYTVVRPGQLFGGPYDNNYYLGTLFQLDKDAATQDVVVAEGDSLVGDTLRSTLAEVIALMVREGAALDMDMSVVNQKGTPPTEEEMVSRLMALSPVRA